MVSIRLGDAAKYYSVEVKGEGALVINSLNNDVGNIWIRILIPQVQKIYIFFLSQILFIFRVMVLMDRNLILLIHLPVGYLQECLAQAVWLHLM